MAWKGIHLSQAAYLSLSCHQLKIHFRHPEEGAPQALSLPLEDLDYLVIDTPEVTLSAPLLTALSKASVLLIGVDDCHQPCWAAFPWAAYYQQGSTLALQLAASQPFKKQLWASIIRQKVSEQARCLEMTEEQHKARHLRAMIRQILSGDTSNVEARAARFYWSALFGMRSFTRHTDDLPNALLNYGYALIRAAIARNLCALGFVPQIGLHHRSKGNAFNLADDLIEPYRPYVDYRVVQILGSEPSKGAFTKEHRQRLVQILSGNVLMEGEVVALTVSIERTVSGLRHALHLRSTEPLVFPTFQAALVPTGSEG